MSREEIKAYVVATIRTGDKERIAKVLKRYFAWQKEEEATNLYETAKDIFQ